MRLIQYTGAARSILFRLCPVSVTSPSWFNLGAVTGTNVHVSGFQEEPGGRWEERANVLHQGWSAAAMVIN